MKHLLRCTATAKKSFLTSFIGISLCLFIFLNAATAQSTGGYTISNNGATGVNAQKTQLLDFTNYNNTTAITSGGQSFTFTLANGYQLSLTARNVGGTYLGAVACPTITTGTQTPLGYSGYTGLAGKPALYMNNNYNVDMIFSGITLTDAGGNTVPNFTMALFDAERTGVTSVTETITGITNGGNWAAYESIGSGNFPTQAGIGSTSLTWTGNYNGVSTGAYAASTTNPTQLEVKMFGYEAFAIGVYVPMGYVYVHQKHINEENAVDYSFTMTNSLGVTTKSFSLNDQSTSDNTAYSGNFIQTYDIGVGHGPAGDGELWAVAGSAATGLSNTSPVSGTVYHRSTASSQWTSLSITGVTALDGAYAGQFVYSTSAGVFFYNQGTSTQIYTTGSTITDVTCNNGYIAMVTSAGAIYYYTNTYTPNAAPATGGTWTSVLSTGVAGTRIDMNIGATSIAYIKPGTATIYTVNFSGTSTSLGTAGSGATGFPADIAYDDNGNIYATCSDNTNGGTSVVASYNPTTSAWTTELPAREVSRLTGGAAKQVYGIELYTYPTVFPETIWYRATDNTGTAYWIDDERIKNAGLNGNGLILPVPSGTFTVNETIPSSSYDLGRFNIYDPGNATTINLVNNNAQTTVSAGEVVYIEFVNEKLNPKAISLTCTQQVLQSFDAGTGIGQYGTGTYGTAVEGSAYHYYGTTTAADGYYEVVKNTTNDWYSNPGITDHTGNGGYFLLVNASYAKDEFYRQRVTNLVPGLTYTISFYSANMSSGTPITPNVTYGLQDLSGNIVNTATTGNFANDNNWHYYTFTFTATTSTADLFLRNQNIGGNGNDIGLDDISINPVIIPLPSITVSPVIKPNVCIGTNYTFSNSQSGGIWSSNPTSVATINANSGAAKGKVAGTAIITYTYTNAIGCITTANTGIIVSAPPTVTAADQLGTGTVCLNQADSLYSTPSGGTAPYTYAWSASPSSGSGLGTATIQNTIAIPSSSGPYNYTILVTDSVGCSATATLPLTVSAHTAPTPSATISAGPYCVAAAITLGSSATGGSGSYTYAWTGAPTTSTFTNASSANTTVTPNVAGTYIYKVTVNDGYCTVVKALSAIVINDHPVVTLSGPSGTQQLCLNATYAIRSAVTGGNGTYTYSWTAATVSGNDNNPGLQSPTNTANVTAKPTLTLSTSVIPDVYKYSVAIVDGNGCTTSGSTTVTAYLNALAAAPTVSVSTPSSATAVCSGGTINLTGSATATFPSTISGFSWTGPGTFTSTVLSPGTVTPSGSGTYTLTVTASNGCSAAATSPAITVNANPVPSVTAAFPNLCTGQATDTVYLSVSGASGSYSNYNYGFTYNGGGYTTLYSSANTAPASSVTGTSFSNGTYVFYYTVQDASSNCSATAQTTVTKITANPPTITGMAAAATPCINTTKTFSPAVTAGSSTSLTYLWTGTPTGNGLGATNTASTTITPTAAGSYTYTLKVTDGNNCSATGTTGTQTVYKAIAVSVASSSPGFCGASGSLNLLATVSGGSGTYSNYAWSTAVITSPGSTTVSPTSSTTTGSAVATISGATVGTSQFQYTATVTDNTSGCTGTGASTILVTGSTPTATVTATSNSTCAGSATVITLKSVFSGGTAVYNYTWTPPSNSVVTPSSGSTSSSPVTATATATAAQNYVWGFELVDANNCVATGNNGTLALNAGLTVGISADNYAVCQNPATTIHLTGTLTPTTAPYTYAWSGSGVNNNTSSITTTAVPALTGTYAITVTDGAGCIGTATTAQTVVVDQATPSISLTCGTNSSGINYGQLFEANGSTWLWTTTSGGRFYTDNTLSVNSDATTSTLEGPFITYNGLYSVKITDAAGCTGTGNYTLTSSSCNVVLAVTELGFTAQKRGMEGLLAWTTASETDNNHFAIQRSTDGIIWEQIGTVKAIGNSTTPTKYSFVDALPLNGINYYRLQQVNDNGQMSYSQVRQLTFANQWLVQMYPNPAQSFLMLQFNNNKDEKGFITIQSALGNTVFSLEQQIAKGPNVVKLDQLQRLAQGTYIITLGTTDNIYRAKFVKGGN